MLTPLVVAYLIARTVAQRRPGVDAKPLIAIIPPWIVGNLLTGPTSFNLLLHSGKGPAWLISGLVFFAMWIFILQLGVKLIRRVLNGPPTR
jgi:hypothetical protein